MRTRRGNRVVLLTAVAAAAVLALWAALRGSSTLSTTKSPDSEQLLIAERRLIAEGRRAYAAIPMRRLRSRDDLRETLAAMNFQNAPPDGVGDATALLDAVEEFLYYRFVQTSVSDYKAWRRSTGHELKSLDELLDPWFIDEVHVLYFDEPMPSSADVESLFDRFWPAGLSYRSGANRPVAIASTKTGLQAVFGTLTPGNPRSRALLEGDLGAALWHGRTSFTFRRWWQQPHDTDSLIKRFGEANYADVGIIIEYADGSRRPFVLTMLWYPDERRWEVEHINAYNFLWDDISGLEY